MTTHRSAAKGVDYSFAEDDRKVQDDLLKDKSKAAKKHNKAIPSYVSDLATSEEDE